MQAGLPRRSEGLEVRPLGVGESTGRVEPSEGVDTECLAGPSCRIGVVTNAFELLCELGGVSGLVGGEGVGLG